MNSATYIFLLVLCYDFYLTFAFFRFTKEDKSKLSWMISYSYLTGTFLFILSFLIFKWYVAIAICLLTILCMGYLNSYIGHKVDKFVFKYQKSFIIFDYLLILFIVNSNFINF